MALQPGQTIGRYQIIEPLGTGGMATVYKAYQPSLEREVALKVLRPGFAEDPEFLQRFQREARSIAKLRHPHIVQIFDFEPLEGRYVLAMEYLEGGTLKERIHSLAEEGKRLPPAEVARIVGEVADALNHGHELGIVHRDMKPSNVMLARRDRAVVTDFGIAKIVGGEGQTQTGVGIGTPEYMAPEQGAGGKVDARADIYSLAVMAYELLAGRVPFVADTPLAVVLAHVRDPLPLPSSIEPSISADTERVLMKALAKDPKDRYATATEFADALKAALVTAAPTSATVYPITAAARSARAVPAGVGGPLTRIPRNALIGAAVLALLLVGGAAFAVTRGGGTTTATGSETVLFELDPARALQQLRPSPNLQLKAVPGGVEVTSGARSAGQLQLQPQLATSDFAIQLRMRFVSGSGNAGVNFHGDQTGEYGAVVSTSGQVTVRRDAPSQQQPQPLALDRQPAGVRAELGKDFELKVVDQGGKLTIFIDGIEYAKASEPSAGSGAIGVFVGSFNDPFTVVFTKVRITGTAVAGPQGGQCVTVPGAPPCPQPAGQPQGGQCVTVPGQPPCPQPGGLSVQRGSVLFDVLQANGYTVQTGASSFVRQPMAAAAGGTALALTPPATGAADATINLPGTPSQFWADIDYQYPQSRSVATAFFFRTQAGNAYSLWLLGGGAGGSVAIRYGATGSQGLPNDIQSAAIPTSLAPPPSGVPTLAPGSARLSLVVQAQTFTVLINGQQILQVNDSRLTSVDALLSLRVARLGGAPNESGTILITNFQIYGLTPGVTGGPAGGPSNETTCAPARGSPTTAFRCAFTGLPPGTTVTVRFNRDGQPPTPISEQSVTVLADGSITFVASTPLQQGTYQVVVVGPGGGILKVGRFEVQ